MAIAVEVPNATEETPHHVLVWDPVRNRRIGDPINLGGAIPYAVAWTPDGKQLAIATDDTLVHFFRATGSRHEIGKPIEGVDSPIFALDFSPDGLSTTRLWNAHTGAPVGDQLTAGRNPFTDRTWILNEFISARPSFSPDAHVATPSSDGATTVWDLSAADWLSAACDLVGRNLTRDEWRQHVGTSQYRKTCT